MQNLNKKRLTPYIALVIAMILWASSFIATKYVLHTYDPIVIIFCRMVIASLCFMTIGRNVVSSQKYLKGDYKLILFMALCEPCLYFLFEINALMYTTASQAGIITAFLPILVMFSAALFLQEKSNYIAVLGAVLAFIGVTWLTGASTPSEDAPRPILGNFLEFMAMVCATGYTIAIKNLTKRYSPFFLTAVQAFIGCIFYLPLLFLPTTKIPSTFHLGPSLTIIYLGAVITLGAYGLYNYSLKNIPAAKAASFVNLIPVFSVILGWSILDEKLTISQLLASILIMTGVYLAQNKKSSQD